MTMQPHVRHFFLGANSQYGFYSLYDQFAAAPQDRLHIIKGGPGTGKSTFMKRIGKAAEDRGMEVEYIRCSGDPDSLDGVYIPALRHGWADGTAPHILEPKHFGIDGTYVDLGRFCRTEALASSAEDIIQTTAAYRQCYQKAYTYLEAVGKLTNDTIPCSPAAMLRIRNRARSKIKKELSCVIGGSAPPVKRFLSAISCKGRYFLTETYNLLCNRFCILESHHGLEQVFFEEILCEANKRHIFYILCPSPLNPHIIESILFPQLKLCFTAYDYDFRGKKNTLHLDSHIEELDKKELKKKEKLRCQLMDTAVSHLSEAKQLHDRLESYYRPALDTDALNDFTTRTLDSLFH